MTARPDELAAVAALLAGDRLLDLLRRSGLDVGQARATYLRVKPGSGALLGIELTPAGAPAGVASTPAYLRLHGPERSRQLAAKWAHKHPVETAFGAGVRPLADDRGVLFVFPNDAVLRDLDAVADARKLKRLLAELPEFGAAGWRVRGRASTFTTVRYKPERRLIQRASLALRNDATGADTVRRVFLRFFVDERGHKLVRLLRELRGQGLAAHTPAPLGAVFDGRLFVEAEIAGHELLDDAARDPGVAPAVAEILVRLHRARTTGLSRQTPDAVCVNADEGARALATALPAAATRLRTLLLRLHSLAARAPAATATLHGDCHLHQFLASDTGLVLVDFERACLGDPAFDLGHLCAHAQSSGLRNPAQQSALQAFATGVVAAYRYAAPTTDLRALPLYLACGLLDRALLPYRHLEPGWEATTTALIDAALAACGAGTAPPAPTSLLAQRRAPLDRGDSVFYPEPGSVWSGTLSPPGARKVYGTYDHGTDAFAPCDPADDQALPGLRAGLSGGELVAYRAGRRATVCVAAPRPAFVKFVPPRKIDAIAARQRFAALQARPFPRVAELLAVDAELGALHMAPLPGTSLHDILMRNQDPPAELFRDLARAIAALHATPGASALPARGTERPLATWLGFVARHDTDLASELLPALDAVSALPESDAEATALVHGDLHDRNIFLDATGIGLIDLDGLGAGDAHEEVGNLAAHFVLRALQRGASAAQGTSHATAWLAAYAAAAPAFDPAAAQAAIARALLRLACLYRFRSQWSHLSRSLAAAAIGYAEDRSSP